MKSRKVNQMTARFCALEDANALAQDMADRIGHALSDAIKLRGAASMAVSGGSTPKRFFDAVSHHALDWSKVVITLVDERFVPPDDERSNHRLVATHLLRNEAANARFVPLYHAAPTVDEAARMASEETAAISNPFDVVILGMGNDGHTASFFPNGSHLAQALEPNTPRGVISMEAPGSGEPRLTFTFSALQDARFLLLHIEGQIKKETLEKAQMPGEEVEMPIRAILRRAKTPLNIFWAP